MLPTGGYLIADPNNRKLEVTAPVAHLERIEKLINVLDLPAFSQSVRKFIEIKHGDATEIASILRILVNNSMTARGSPALAGGSVNEAVQMTAAAKAMWR